MADGISPQLLQALTDLTGERQLNNALRTVTHDAIAHRLALIAKQLHAFKQKHSMSLEVFEAQFQAAMLPQEDSYEDSYEVEQDYLEWEGLLCRQRRLLAIQERPH
jgi:hypothetical protein